MKRILVAILSTTITLGAVEGALRWWEGRRAGDALSGHALRRLPQKAEGDVRIFVYGGSTVWGWPTPRVGFVAQMQAFLEERYDEGRVEVRNFGVGAASSARVLREVTASLRDEPDAIVVMTGHNEFLWPIQATDVRLLEDTAQSMHTFALVRAVERFVRTNVRGTRRELLFPDKLSVYARDSEEFLARVGLYEENLEAIVNVARQHGVPLFLCTLVSNELDWPPVYRDVRPPSTRADYEREIDRLLLLAETADPGEMQDALDGSLERYPDDPMLIYLSGRQHYARGEEPRARALLRLAKDSDPVPYRVLSRFNRLIREFAHRDSVQLVDIEERLRDESERGVVGRELMADNCHPTPRGNYWIATEILGRLEHAGIVQRLGRPSGELDFGRFLSASGFAAERMNYLLTSARYCMKTPFLNYSEAREHLEAAQRLDPDRWEVWANLATTSLFQGKVETGRVELARAMKLAPAPIDLDDLSRVPYLKEALEMHGLGLESVSVDSSDP